MSNSSDPKTLIGERLKAARDLTGLTQAQVAERLQVTEMTVYRWESGKFEPSYRKLKELSDLYRQPVETFISSAPTTTVGPTPPGVVSIPIRGYISAGVPRDHWEVDLGTLPMSEHLIGRYSELFAMVISGDGLKGDGIHDGDLVCVDPGAVLEEGKIYVVRMEEGEICARHLKFEDGQVRLRSSYEHYDELRIAGVKLLGKIVWHLRSMD